jgi:hypothetical protein
MDGSSLSLIVIPTVVSLGLAAWLIIVYYAASHPLWKEHSPAPGHARPRVAAAATGGRRPRSTLAQNNPAWARQCPGPAAAHREPASAQAALPAADPAHAA